MTISSAGRIAATLLILCAVTSGVLVSYHTRANSHAQELQTVLNLDATEQDKPAPAEGVEVAPNVGVFDAGRLQKTISILTETKTTLDYLDNPLLDAIKALERQLEVTIRVDLKGADKKTVTVAVQRQPFGQALQAMLSTCQCEYSILPDGTLRIAAKRDNNKRDKDK
jgi:hypothetical protein